MTNITLSVPEKLHKRMKVYDYVKWSVIVRKALESKVSELEKMDALAEKINLSEKDATEIAKIVKKDMARELGIK